jgi:spectinomycin phosphotransferase
VPALARWARDDFGVTLVGLDLVHGGVDEHAQVWHGRADDGAQYAIKLTAGGSDAGLTLPRYLVDHAVPGVAAPLPTRTGALWGDHDGCRLTLTPWAGDDRAIETGMSLDQWQTFGVMLARLHATPPPTQRPLPVEQHRPDAVTEVIERVRRRIADPGPFDDVSAEVCDLWQAAAPGLQLLVGTAQTLAPIMRDRAAVYVVCHADPHVGNVILDAAGRVWLIDWDDAVTAPPELDLMFVVDGGILASNPVTADEQEAFFDGYGPVSLDRERLTYYQAVRALVDVGDFSFWALDPDRPAADRQEALEIVRLAFRDTSLIARALRRTG